MRPAAPIPVRLRPLARALALLAALLVPAAAAQPLTGQPPRERSEEKVDGAQEAPNEWWFERSRATWLGRAGGVDRETPRATLENFWRAATESEFERAARSHVARFGA